MNNKSIEVKITLDKKALKKFKRQIKIDPKELRIGNHAILISNGEQKQLSGHDIYLAQIFPEHDFDPIPLTPEWLERLGFVFDAIDKDWFHDPKDKEFVSPFYCVAFVDGDWLLKWDMNEYFGTPIKSVHQLQNLFFALTGEEL